MLYITILQSKAGDMGLEFSDRFEIGQASRQQCQIPGDTTISTPNLEIW